MSNINRAIAESMGYTVTKARSGYWALRLNGGGNIGNFVTENLAWDHAPDFEHDLNDAIELMKQMPLIEVFYDGKQWCVAAVVPVYGTDLARAICEAYCQFKGIAIPEK